MTKSSEKRDNCWGNGNSDGDGNIQSIGKKVANYYNSN